MIQNALKLALPVGEKLPQVELAFGGEATVTPLSKVTLSATPDNPTPLFGLVRVKVRVLVPPQRKPAQRAAHEMRSALANEAEARDR